MKFEVGQRWRRDDGEIMRIVALDDHDSRPVVARSVTGGALTGYTLDGVWGREKGPFDLVERVPDKVVRFVALYRDNDTGKEIAEIVESGGLTSATKYLNHTLVSVQRVEFEEGRNDG